METNLCSDLLEKPLYNYVPGMHHSIAFFISGLLNMFMSVLTVVWIKWHEIEAQAEFGREDAVKSVIFPVFVRVLWVSAIFGFVGGVLTIVWPIHGGNNGLVTSIAYSIFWAAEHGLLEGVAFLLMQKGCGQHAAKRAAIWSTAWFLVMFIIMFMFFYVGGLPSTICTTFRDASLLIFYLVLWFAPQERLFRRPAAVFYSKCWTAYRVGGILLTVLSVFSESRSVGNCGIIMVDLVVFAVIEPLFLYWTFLRDSRWWQGIDIGNVASTQPPPGTPGGPVATTGNLRSPLLGSEYSIHSAQSLAGTMDDMRVHGKVRMLNFACIRLDTHKTLGAGSFSKVYMGAYRGQECAIKLIYTMDLTQDVIQRVAAEASILTSIQHPNTVNILGVSVLPPSVCLILELCSFGSLSDIIRGYGFDWNASHRAPLALCYADMLHLALGCAKGLAAVHAYDPSLCHRDVKSFNFLVDFRFNVKIADLELGIMSGRQRDVALNPYGRTEYSQSGSSGGANSSDLSIRFATEGDSGADSGGFPFGAGDFHVGEEHLLGGTARRGASKDPEAVDINELLANWLAPEVLLDRKFQQASDVFALGTVLWEIISGELPFADEPPAAIRRKIMTGYMHPIPADYGGSNIAKLIVACWARNPLLRPSAEQLADELELSLRGTCPILNMPDVDAIPDTTTLMEFYDENYRSKTPLGSAAGLGEQGGYSAWAPSLCEDGLYSCLNPMQWYRVFSWYGFELCLCCCCSSSCCSDSNKEIVTDYKMHDHHRYWRGRRGRDRSSRDKSKERSTGKRYTRISTFDDAEAAALNDASNNGAADGSGGAGEGAGEGGSPMHRDDDSFRDSFYSEASRYSVDSISRTSATTAAMLVEAAAAGQQDLETGSGRGGGGASSGAHRRDQSGDASRHSSYLVGEMSSAPSMNPFPQIPRSALDVIGVIKEQSYWDLLEESREAWAVTTIDAPYIVMHATAAWYRMFHLRHSIGSYQQMYSIVSLLNRQDRPRKSSSSSAHRFGSNAYVHDWKHNVSAVARSGGAGHHQGRRRGYTASCCENNGCTDTKAAQHMLHSLLGKKEVHGVLCFRIPHHRSAAASATAAGSAAGSAVPSTASTTSAAAVLASTGGAGVGGGSSTGATGGAPSRASASTHDRRELSSIASAVSSVATTFAGGSERQRSSRHQRSSCYHMMCTVHAYPVYPTSDITADHYHPAGNSRGVKGLRIRGESDTDSGNGMLDEEKDALAASSASNPNTATDTMGISTFRRTNTNQSSQTACTGPERPSDTASTDRRSLLNATRPSAGSVGSGVEMSAPRPVYYAMHFSELREHDPEKEAAEAAAAASAASAAAAAAADAAAQLSRPATSVDAASGTGAVGGPGGATAAGNIAPFSGTGSKAHIDRETGRGTRNSKGGTLTTTMRHIGQYFSAGSNPHQHQQAGETAGLYSVVSAGDDGAQAGGTASAGTQRSRSLEDHKRSGLPQDSLQDLHALSGGHEQS